MKKISVIALACVAQSTFSTAQADGRMSPASHAPIGVMGDHLHKPGGWMVSYRYMSMDMDGNRIDQDRVSARDIVGTGSNPGQFLVAPTQMTMQMHMLGVMYGLSNRVTLMGMLNYQDNKMDHLVRNGRTFMTSSSGIGDTRLSALVSVHDSSHHKVHLNLGVSAPTGSIDERDDTPAMANAVLPYPMQLGSGTWDLMPGVTYNGRADKWFWGAQAYAMMRTDENDENYRLGNQFDATSWLARELSDSISVSARISYRDRNAIEGANPALNASIVRTANPELQAGDRIDFSLGLNYLFRSGHRLAVEYQQPLRQDLQGPQLETDSVITASWQKAF